MKNYNNHINENKSNNYKTYYNLIVKYIRTTLKSKKQINEYVPNTHIAEIFREVLIYLELENMYPIIFHDEYIQKGGTIYHEIIKKSNYHVLSHIDEYFNSKLLKENGIKEIHKVYQKLRIKDNYLRILMKLVNLHLNEYINMHLHHRNLIAHKIRIINKK